VWVWKPEEDGETFYYDMHEPIRFRVEKEKWVDQTPLGPNEKENGVEKSSPYMLEGSMAEDGLGPCLWWD
jgi:DNA-directed RNA polymerase III subunit RPC8